MFRVRKNATIEELIDLFREGVLMKDHGHLLAGKQVEWKGFRRQIAAIRHLDKFGEAGRQALVFLMYNDPAPGVRTWAAGELLDDKPELAVPVLKQIHESGRFHQRSSAFNLLLMHEMNLENPEAPSALAAAARTAALAEAAARYEAETAQKPAAGERAAPASNQITELASSPSGDCSG